MANKRKCNNCGNELPADSLFCQYCGSKDLVDIEPELTAENQTKIEPTEIDAASSDKAYCADCHKELPSDSSFCQFCGSKNITRRDERLAQNASALKTAQETQIKKIVPTTYYQTIDEHVSPDRYKKFFIITCVLAVLLGVLSGYLFYNQSQLNQNINELNETISSLRAKLSLAESKTKTAESKASKNQTKADKYDALEKAIANQTKYSDFYVSTQFVKGTSQTITVYAYRNSSYTVWAQGSGYVNCEWLGEFTGSGTQTARLRITCTSGKYGTVTLTNDWNSEKITIFVSGS